MHLAEVLSDLTSLRVCDPKDALALVHPPTIVCSSSESSNTSTKEDPNDPFLLAQEFLELHSQQHDGRELERVRREVGEAMRKLMGAGGDKDGNGGMGKGSA